MSDEKKKKVLDLLKEVENLMSENTEHTSSSPLPSSSEVNQKHEVMVTPREELKKLFSAYPNRRRASHGTANNTTRFSPSSPPIQSWTHKFYCLPSPYDVRIFISVFFYQSVSLCSYYSALKKH